MRARVCVKYALKVAFFREIQSLFSSLFPRWTNAKKVMRIMRCCESPKKTWRWPKISSIFHVQPDELYLVEERKGWGNLPGHVKQMTKRQHCVCGEGGLLKSILGFLWQPPLQGVLCLCSLSRETKEGVWTPGMDATLAFFKSKCKNNGLSSKKKIARKLATKKSKTRSSIEAAFWTVSYLLFCPTELSVNVPPSHGLWI